MAGKKRNPLNLSLPPTVVEEGGRDGNVQELPGSLEEGVQGLQLSGMQQESLKNFLKQKEKVSFPSFYVFVVNTSNF